MNKKPPLQTVDMDSWCAKAPTAAQDPNPFKVSRGQQSNDRDCRATSRADCPTVDNAICWTLESP